MNEKNNGYTKTTTFGSWQFGKIGGLVNSISQKLKSKDPESMVVRPIDRVTFIWLREVAVLIGLATMPESVLI